MHKKTKLLLFFILLGAFLLRTYDINWDQGYHLHPDERAITLHTLPLAFPSTVQEFFSTASPLNPHFFPYGSFPLYLLKFFGSLSSLVNPLLGSYMYINIIGRFISAIADTITLFVIYCIGKKIADKETALLAAFFYGMGVLPIQLSHFYAVDTLLTLFTSLTLFYLLRFYEKSTTRNAILIGLFFGLSLATKNSALVIVTGIGMTLLVDFILLIGRAPHKTRLWLPSILPALKRLLRYGFIMLLTTAVVFFVFEPYAVIDFPTFWLQTMQQSLMTKSAFTFPYTLQYVGKTPYLYELKQIFFWGFGPILGTLTVLGTCVFSFITIKRIPKGIVAKELILLSFFWVYFAIVGSFAIGFIRYLLPLYPLLSLFGALFMQKIFKKVHRFFPKFSLAFTLLFFVSLCIWPFSFMYIYSSQNTRVLASYWITQTIPYGKRIAVEHWDDSLPLFDQQNYVVATLPLYDPDTYQKWQAINQTLSQTDYIILASNRLSTPLQKLTNCNTLPQQFCYKRTAKYYHDLFSGKLGFKKVAEFSVTPRLPLFSIAIPDESADESFTVYDHPTVTIFQRELRR